MILVDKNADAETIEGFLSKQISAKNGYEFYELLRQESENRDFGLVSRDSTDKTVSDEPQATNHETKTKRTTKKKAETKKKSAGRATRSRSIGTARSTGKSVKTKKKTKKK